MIDQRLWGINFVQSEFVVRVIDDQAIYREIGKKALEQFTPKPCRYCGRARQNAAHKTCDGCGYPLEGK